MIAKSMLLFVRVWSRLLSGVVATLLGVNLLAATTTVDIFSGGEPGEGLDLEGNFLHAANIGSTVTSRTVQGVQFTTEAAAGLTVRAAALIETWGNLDLGESVDDANLEVILNSIRHMGATGQPLEVEMSGLEPGADYKLQLLFTEACCPRGFDVMVDGELIVDEFSPGVVQGGVPPFGFGVVVTHEFTAAATSVVISLTGTSVTTPEYTDLNPILSGVTLERTSAVVDSDGDGLTDDWEFRFFGNLDQSGSTDADEDGLENTGEFSAGADPTDVDSDNDGLEDGPEASTHETDPTNRDSDGDGIWDGDEVNTWNTDPNLVDTDEDGFTDFDELRLLTDPNADDSTPRNTQISQFSGGDPGEGLDLQGTFVYAVDAGLEFGPLGQIGDAFFTGDVAVDGLTLTSGNTAPVWHDPTYGDTVEDDLLELLMSSIRWSAAGAVIPNVTFEFANLELGAAYKLQLLIAEQGWPRGADIIVNGALIVDDFSAPQYQGGYSKTNGVVITHTFIARADKATVVLDGTAVTLPQYTDHNAIIQGATLELISANVDSDSDGLTDPWELDSFGDLTRGANDDSDGDDLTNIREFELNLDPARADTDRDSLDDGAEVNTHQTDPRRPDTDSDGLSDSAEINTHSTDPNNPDTDGDRLNDFQEVNVALTDPKKADTDGDGVNDFDEIRLLTDPNDSASTSQNTSINLFSGGDPGEGLDLQGTFIYAINAGPDAGDIGQIGDAYFTPDAVEGVTLTSGNMAGGWHFPSFGDSLEDDLLEMLMSSIRWSDVVSANPNVTLEFTNLEAGQRYKLQLLFAEACCQRGFDISFNGTQIADEFSPMVYQGGFDPAIGVVFTHEFTATAATTTVVLSGVNVTTPQFTDRNAIVQGATLEHLGEATAEVLITNFVRSAEDFTITIGSSAGATYQLQYRENLSSGEWVNAGAAVTATGAATELRDTEVSHLNPASGFWRVTQE